MKRAAIYTRVSLDASGDGRSVERQLEACRAMAKARGWTVAHEESDNSISAYSGKERPAWLRVLGLVERGEVDYVIAWHIDRMTRSMLDLEQLIILTELHGVGIATASGDIDLTTDVGRMVARILAAVARAEVERKAARQRLANEQHAAAGRPFTGGPRAFGYAAGDWEVIPEEAEAVRWAAEAALNGATLISIARELDKRGLESSRAKYTEQGWSANGVKKMLTAPRYAGIRMHKGAEVGMGTWQPILDLDTHLALRAKLTDSKRRSGRGNGAKPVNLLSQIAHCTRGETLKASSRKGKLVYTCEGGHVRPDRDVLDKEVTERMLGLLSTPGFIASVTPSGNDRADEARSELDALHGRLRVLGEGFVDGTVDEGLFRDLSRTLRDRIDALEVELTLAATGTLLNGLNVGTSDVVARWSTLPLERQRLIIATFLDIEVQGCGVGRTWNAGQHLTVKRQEPRPL